MQKNELRIFDTIVKCKDDPCNWLQFRRVYGKLLTVNDIKLWVDKGKSSLIKGMKSKAGKSFDAFIVLNDAGETSFEFDN
jgi:DNA topoisomerase-3